MIGDQVHKNFPNHIDVIQALLEKDDAFRRICAGYEEVCTWLDHHCRSADRSNECECARELVGELEGEIIRYLKQ